MVQTVFCEQENVNIETFWKEVTPEMLMDSKLRCVFEVPAQEQTRVGASGAETATFHNVSNNETHKAAQDGDVGDSLELQKATAEVSVSYLVIVGEKFDKPFYRYSDYDR